MVRFAGLDKAIVPAGRRCLSRDRESLVLLRVTEDRQLLWGDNPIHMNGAYVMPDDTTPTSSDERRTHSDTHDIGRME